MRLPVDGCNRVKRNTAQEAPAAKYRINTNPNLSPTVWPSI